MRTRNVAPQRACPPKRRPAVPVACAGCRSSMGASLRERRLESGGSDLPEIRHRPIRDNRPVETLPSMNENATQATGTAGRLRRRAGRPEPARCREGTPTPCFPTPGPAGNQKQTRACAPEHPTLPEPRCPTGEAPPSPWPAQVLVTGWGRLYGHVTINQPIPPGKRISETRYRPGPDTRERHQGPKLGNRPVETLPSMNENFGRPRGRRGVAGGGNPSPPPRPPEGLFGPSAFRAMLASAPELRDHLDRPHQVPVEVGEVLGGDPELLVESAADGPHLVAARPPQPSWSPAPPNARSRCAT